MKAAAIALIAAGCCSPRAAAPAGPPKTIDTAVAPLTAPQCPIVMRERAPGVSWYGSIAEASKHLPTIAQDPEAPPLDLVALAKQSNAFFTTRPEGYLHESVSTVAFHDAVFVQPNRVTLVTRIFETISAMPPHCGNRAAAETLDIAIVNPHLGHLRIRQPIDPMEPTAPAAPLKAAAHVECACRTSYIVEDHFIDLDRGEHLRSFAQIYEDDCYQPGTPTVLAFAAFVPKENGVEIESPACVFYWDQ